MPIPPLAPGSDPSALVPDERSPGTSATPANRAHRAVMVAAVLLSALTLYTLRSLIPAVLFGAWLAAVTEPLSARIARRVGGRSRAASVLTLAMLVAMGLVCTALVLPAISDLSMALRAVRKTVSSGGALASLSGALHAAPAAQGSAPASSHSVFLGLARDMAPIAEAAAAATASLLIQLFVFVATAYYLVIDGRRLLAGLERVSPFGPEHTRTFVREFVAVGRGIALSMGITGIATAALLGVTFAATGTPRALLLTTVAFVAAMLPVGAHVVWAPIAGWMAYRGHHGAAIALTTVGIVGVGGLVDHVLRPWLVRFGKLELHPLLTLLGLFGGVVAFGAWGVFLGPLVIAMTATALGIAAQRPILARRSLIPGERITRVSSLPAPVVPAPVVAEPTIH